ncbi:MAG: F0F1 ATP synthase subunit C [Alphaproteobacteria bacterium]|nr:F0F1 ATP synthase subunit C [Alphaproteobacteria bacterium]
MDAITFIGGISVMAAALCISIGGLGSALGEGNAAASALRSLAQQPDESGTITRVLFVSMAMLETEAIYAFVITILILYFNPFWDYAVAAAAK